ncbi:MerR family transcriptional regulator, Zn(II)-responsive regulator of zntA [Clostridium acidisoli DSM 12555]|uniref:MerR family transcriptional regulator, Zn(II)-responsive regulator of zntA n=2 Tax=Clostridium TaxID=1485 RepID=A0A1W1XX92_9CLOT|nr:MerR family transcriptional regulator, Zn(II)-responsive regulator of zntA [Clostridium acidisoli DSM 12555]
MQSKYNIGEAMKEVFGIGELVKELNINKETVRYYEKIGLLSQPKRDANGYRIYTKNDLDKIKIILIIKRFGFSIKEIDIIFSKIYNEMLGKDIYSIKNIVKYKINEINIKIDELENTKKLLEKINDEVLSQNEVSCHDLDIFWRK